MIEEVPVVLPIEHRLETVHRFQFFNLTTVEIANDVAEESRDVRCANFFPLIVVETVANLLNITDNLGIGIFLPVGKRPWPLELNYDDIAQRSIFKGICRESQVKIGYDVRFVFVCDTKKNLMFLQRSI